MNNDWLEEEGITSYGTVSQNPTIEILSPPTKSQELESFLTKSEPSKFRLWELGYYQPFFDVDTQTVLGRLRKVVYLNSEQFFEDKQPDMYVPFWAITTLIFLYAVISANAVSEDIVASSASTKLVSITSFMYTIALVIPTLSYCYISHEGGKIMLIEILSLYGYSFIPFMFAGGLCLFNYMLLRWCAMIVAGVWSGYFFYKYLPTNNDVILETKKYAIAGLASCGHLLLVLISNTYFF